MCESVKMLEDEESLQKKRDHLLNTFGFPQVSMKNESISNQVPSNDAFEIKEGHTFTFKEVINNSNNVQSNNHEINFDRPPSSVDENRKIVRKDEQEINSLAEAR